MEGEEKKREGEKDAHRHAHRNAWLVPQHILHIESISENSSSVSSEQPTQLVCEDSRQSQISLLLCSHHWSQPHPLPHLLPSLSARGLIVDSSPPAPPRPSLLPLARGLLLPVYNAQFSRGDGHLLSHHRSHLNPTQVW